MSENPQYILKIDNHKKNIEDRSISFIKKNRKEFNFFSDLVPMNFLMEFSDKKRLSPVHFTPFISIYMMNHKKRCTIFRRLSNMRGIQVSIFFGFLLLASGQRFIIKDKNGVTFFYIKFIV